MDTEFNTLKKNIEETREWLSREFSTIRTGRASVNLLDNVRPEVYGSRVPLNQVASISPEDARTIRILPYDKTTAKAIEKSIAEADLGVSAVVDDSGLRIIFPDLTSERRAQLAKLAQQKLEEAKVTLRGHRSETIKNIEAKEKDGGFGKDDIKRFKDEVQKLIDAGTEALVVLLTKKEQEIAL
jgi:ribosome recycling factor